MWFTLVAMAMQLRSGVLWPDSVSILTERYFLKETNKKHSILFEGFQMEMAMVRESGSFYMQSMCLSQVCSASFCPCILDIYFISSIIRQG